MKKIEAALVRIDDPLNASVLVHQREAHSLQGQFFAEMVKINSHVAKPVAFHEPSGRQQFSPLELNEVVARAEAITEAAWEALERNGWSIDLPGLDELKGTSTRTKTGF